ncbi:MAG: YgjV family protein [Clostridia bacterium]|nr:YgjV family protein [Clostridia bacterium]
MEFVISQICGIVVTVAVIISMQLKNIKPILISQLIINGVGAVSYIMVGGFSGCGLYLVAVLQASIYFVFRKKDVDAPRAVDIIFILLFLGCALSTYKRPADIITVFAAATCALGLTQKKPFGYRICMLFNGIIWMVYDVGVGAYTMILSHFVTAAAAIIGIVRLDIKKSKVEE